MLDILEDRAPCWQGKNGVEVPDTNPSTQPDASGYILEYEHFQNYDGVPNVTGAV